MATRKRAAAPAPDAIADDATYQCVKCGAQYSAVEIDNWGSDGLGDGYGPTPVCVELVPDQASAARIRNAADDQARENLRATASLQACKGQLRAI